MKRLFIVIALVIVALIATTTQSSAQTTINACVSKTGAVRIVTSSTDCAKGDKFISWNQQGPQGPAGTGNLGVYDGNNLFLGYFQQAFQGADYSQNYIVFNPDISAFLFLYLDGPPAFYPVSASEVYFTTEDCTGQPYFSPHSIGDSVQRSIVGIHFLMVLDPMVYGQAWGGYYVYDPDLPVMGFSKVKSMLQLEHYNQTGNNDCLPPPALNSISHYAFPMKHIEPFNPQLQYPIRVKPIE